jgi:hypothetical protein
MATSVTSYFDVAGIGRNKSLWCNGKNLELSSGSGFRTYFVIIRNAV